MVWLPPPFLAPCFPLVLHSLFLLGRPASLATPTRPPPQNRLNSRIPWKNPSPEPGKRKLRHLEFPGIGENHFPCRQKQARPTDCPKTQPEHGNPCFFVPFSAPRIQCHHRRAPPQKRLKHVYRQNFLVETPEKSKLRHLEMPGKAKVLNACNRKRARQQLPKSLPEPRR